MNRNRIAAFILLVLIAALTFSSTIVRVTAVSVAITTFTPVTHTGYVGQTVNIVGTINTTNGNYKIFFANQTVVNQTASGNAVNATFPIPSTPQGSHIGNYTLTLQDVNKNINATSYFIVQTSYQIKVDESMLTDSKQFQEGDTIGLTVNITGGYANKAYHANVTVALPAGVLSHNESSTLLSVNTSDKGYGISKVSYPNASVFSGVPNTNYVGTYTASFNSTLATDSFVIGLTNTTQYHRRQIADISAYGYQSSEQVNITILNVTSSLQTKLLDSFRLNASSAGIVHTSWPVPSVVHALETYELNITSVSGQTRKHPPDLQSFTIPGYGVNVTCLNLAGDLVPYITIHVNESSIPTETRSGGADGVVHLSLETGQYTSVAFFHFTLPVTPPTPINVTGPFAFYLTCNLTNLRIHTVAMKNGSEIAMPNVMISMNPFNPVNPTDVNGTVTVHSLWAKYNYTVSAYRYNVQYNALGNNTLTSLLVGGSVPKWFNTTIICPNLQLVVNVTDAGSQPIEGTEVVAQEGMGGLSYKAYTSRNGTVAFNCTFGEYVITAYDMNGIVLNQTSIQLLNLTQHITNTTIKCLLYNLTVSIKVVDFFGQPVPSMNVTLQRQGLSPQSMLTQNNGTATFAGITGGNIHVSTYMKGGTMPYATTDFAATKSTLLEFRMSQYVSLAGTLIDVNILAIVLVIVATILIVLLVEIHRKRHSGPKNENTTQNK